MCCSWLLFMLVVHLDCSYKLLVPLVQANGLEVFTCIVLYIVHVSYSFGLFISGLHISCSSGLSSGLFI